MATAPKAPPRRRKKTSSKAPTDDGLDDELSGFGLDKHTNAAADVQDGYVAPEAKPDATSYVGQTILVHWGKEHVQPLRYQGIDIGPFAMEVVVLEGERPIDAKRRAMRHLNEMAEEEYREKLPRFIKRCREVATDL